MALHYDFNIFESPGAIDWVYSNSFFFATKGGRIKPVFDHFSRIVLFFGVTASSRSNINESALLARDFENILSFAPGTKCRDLLK